MSIAAYERAEDVGVVTTYFAPRPSELRRERFDRFVAPLRTGGVIVRVAELVLDGHSPELTEAEDVVRVRGRDALWHKERLLMRAITALPPSCTKVAWVDADVLFDDASWLLRTSRALDFAAVVQPFSQMRVEGQHGTFAGSDVVESYASVLARDPLAHHSGNFDRHGHTGYAWAARRDVLTAHGLYTRAIAGGADHAMAHAFTGDLEGACLDRVLGTGALRADFTAWGRQVRGASIGVVKGEARHLWHGAHAERRYVERYEMLRDVGFDPARDLADDGDVWALSDRADPRLGAWMREYFESRRND